MYGIYCTPGSILHIFCIISFSRLTSEVQSYYSHFLDEKTEAQRDREVLSPDINIII